MNTRRRVLVYALLTSFGLGACASTPLLPSQKGFRWPVRSVKLTQPFRYRHKTHNGIDLAGPMNSPIYAMGAGRVIYVGKGFRGFGNLVMIEHENGEWASLYAHLNRFKVTDGQSVRAGQLIGLMGKTGNASGTHLHFEIRYKKRPVDPQKVLPQGVY